MRSAAGHSQLNLFQETYSASPWQLLCCVIMLNQTSGEQLESVHESFFKSWPSPAHLAFAERTAVEQIIKPLGLQNRRAAQLIRMSAAYAFLWDGLNPIDLPGIGKYGSDSYRIFIRREYDIPVEDKELRKYLEWIKNSRR